ncbi:MAG: Secretion system C-terminal sorting domain, partial [Bacteroidota bacterium]
ISLLNGSVTNSLFQGNLIAFSGYGASITNCQFINNGTAISNFASGSLTNCMIRYNQVGVEITGEAEMTNNDVSSNAVGVKIYDNVAGFTGNRICGNSQYNVENAADKNISLVSNCFCESDSTVAEQLLFDGYDNITRGLFNYAIYDSSCTNVLQLVSKVLIPTGTPEVYLDLISVFPNPVSDVLNVQLPASRSTGEIRLLNLQGQVLRVVPARALTRIDVADLSAGVYLLDFQGAGRQVVKWIKR